MKTGKGNLRRARELAACVREMESFDMSSYRTDPLGQCPEIFTAWKWEENEDGTKHPVCGGRKCAFSSAEWFFGISHDETIHLFDFRHEMTAAEWADHMERFAEEKWG